MIQFLPIVAIGYLGAATIDKFKQKKFRVTKQAQQKKRSKPIIKTEDIRIVEESVIEDSNVILSKEDVPLDNRFGEKSLMSEHLFSRTANITMEMERTKDFSGSLGADIFSLLEAKAQTKLSRALGFKIGSEITREIKLKFSAAPGQFAHYIVTWKQDTRRGVYKMTMDNKQYSIPFMVTYGLCHSVESIDEKNNKNKIEQKPQ